MLYSIGIAKFSVIKTFLYVLVGVILGMLSGLWQYRYFVWSSIRNELISKFARSKFSGIWMIANPLAQVAIYALILSSVLAAKLPGIEHQYAYAIYLMAGLLAWTLFNDIVLRCLNLFVENGNLMKKMSFPRITLPVVAVGTCSVNNFLLLVSMFAVFALLGHQFSLAMLWLFPLTFLLVVFSVGIGLMLGILNVFIRDVGQVVPIVLQMGFWFTPIVYPLDIVPLRFREILDWNPLLPIVEAYQQVLVYGMSPSIEGLAKVSLVALFFMFCSLYLFRRASSEMVDVL